MRRALVAVGALAFLLAGCGGSSSDPLADDHDAPLSLERDFPAIYGELAAMGRALVQDFEVLQAAVLDFLEA